MFTGIVQAMGLVQAMTPTPAGARLVIDRSAWRPDAGMIVRHGESICISGVCLTIVEFDDETLQFDVIGETLAKTTLGSLRPGDAVNLEPSVTGSTPMSGHFVQGHVEGVGVVTHVQRGGDDVRLTVEPPAELMACVIAKGSVAVDGVSMTVAAARDREFELALIPATLAMTTLGRAVEGTKLNVETDILSRTVVHALKQMREGEKAGAVMHSLLAAAGFIPNQAADSAR